MAAIAERPGRPLRIVAGIGIERRPPVAAGVGHMVFRPFLGPDVPLNWQGIVIVARLLEIALLPVASIDEGNVVLRDPGQSVRYRRKVRYDGVGMGPGIAHDVGHAGLLPARINFLVTVLAGFRAHIMSFKNRAALLRAHI